MAKRVGRAGTCLSVGALLSVATAAHAQAGSEGSGMVGIVMALAHFALALLVWLTLTWLFFNWLWGTTDNPFVAIRGAHVITGSGFLAYFLFVLWPQHIQAHLGSGADSLRYTIAGVLLVALLLACLMTYRAVPVSTSGKQDSEQTG